MKTLAIGLTWRQFGNKSCLWFNLNKSGIHQINKQTFCNAPIANCRTIGTCQNKTQNFNGIPNTPHRLRILTASQNVDATDIRNYVSCSKIVEKKPILKDSASMCCESHSHKNFNLETQIHNPSSRHCSSSVAQYESCYIFKYIVHARVLSRLKIYQTVATILMVPPAIYSNNIGLLPTPDMYTMFGITSIACIMLYVMSLYFRSIVGMISVCKENNTVRLSHLTFWGNRNDIYLDPEDIVPLMDMSENARNVYSVLKTYSSDKTFIIFLRYYKRLDKAQLEDVLGRLE